MEDLRGVEEPLAELPEETEEVLAEQPEETEESREAAAEEGKKSGGRKKGLRTAALIAVVLLVLGGIGGTLLAVYRHYEQYYETHFYEGTIINGTDVSFQTVEEVKKTIADNIARYEIRVDEKGGQSEVLTAEDVGWHYVDDRKVDQLMADQDARHWFRYRAASRNYSFAAGADYDPDKARAAIAGLACLDAQNVTSPKDAYLAEQADGNYAVVPEVEGNELDPGKTEETILTALGEARDRVSLEEPDCYLHPEILSDNENLCTRRDEWNRLLAISIAYDFGDDGELIDRAFLKDYITDDGEHVTLSTDWIPDLVYSWAAKYDTFGLEQPFTTHDGKTITLAAGGDYGWCLDKDKTIEDLKKAVEAGESGLRMPIWLYRAMGWSNGGLTGTYVEVSLKKQHLWCYKDGVVVQETDVVTGAPTSDRETHPGLYAIDAKKSPAVLGRREVQGYSSPVSFWCPFNGGQGLHDAPWRNAFGKDIYKSNGSHGCVNIPADKMEVIYNTVEIGTAVVVY